MGDPKLSFGNEQAVSLQNETAAIQKVTRNYSATAARQPNEIIYGSIAVSL
jgi:hypothetical protein